MQVKKNPNKNLNRNRILYFQIGLSIVLILLLLSVEWQFNTSTKEYEPLKYKEMVFEETIEVTLPEKKVKPILKTKQKKPTDDFIIDDKEKNKDLAEELFDKPSKNTNTYTDINPNTILQDLEKPIDEPADKIPFDIVEDVPIFPGCESFIDNAERKACMNKKLQGFITKHFDSQLASELGLKGDYVIYTQFTITHTGEVKFFDARATHPELKREAQRVIQKLPKMIPGKQRLKPVDVIFGLPIRFNIQN